MVNKYGDISPRTALVAAKRLLTVAQPLMITQRFAQQDGQEKNSGPTRKWRRYLPFPAVTSPLVEGVPPEGRALLYEDVVATLVQLGDVVPLTDVIQDLHEDPILKICTDNCGLQSAESVEIVTIDHLKSGSNVFRAGAVASRGDINAAVSRSDIRMIVRQLRRAKAKPITRVIKSSTDYGTQAVEAGYFALCHTDLIPDIKNATGFQSVKDYDGGLEGEIGAIDQIRFICTQNFTPWLAAGKSGTTFLSSGEPVAAAAAADVYPIIVIAADSYGAVHLQGRQAAEMFVLNPGVARETADPLAQKGTVGWKMWYACARLCESWIVRYEVACTAKPN